MDVTYYLLGNKMWQTEAWPSIIDSKGGKSHLNTKLDIKQCYFIATYGMFSFDGTMPDQVFVVIFGMHVHM